MRKLWRWAFLDDRVSERCLLNSASALTLRPISSPVFLSAESAAPKTKAIRDFLVVRFFCIALEHKTNHPNRSINPCNCSGLHTDKPGSGEEPFAEVIC